MRTQKMTDDLQIAKDLQSTTDDIEAYLETNGRYLSEHTLDFLEATVEELCESIANVLRKE